MCSVRKATSALGSKLASGRCNGVAKDKWKEAAVSMASGSAGSSCAFGPISNLEGLLTDRKGGEQHVVVTSGVTVWGRKCVAYVESKAKWLLKTCLGTPVKLPCGGGAWGQLQKLLNGKCPKQGELMPQAINESGTVWRSNGGSYAVPKVGVQQESVCSGFYLYKPELPKVWKGPGPLKPNGSRC